jgi:HEAT repeat protein
VRVIEGATPPLGTYERLRDQLQSPEAQTRREAARTLAVFAPHALETTLLRFPDQPEFKQFAPLALHNLNTPRSISALAEMLLKNPPGSYEHEKVAEYLAQTGDSAWFPVLAQIARDNAGNAIYLYLAAESGGDASIPLILEFMRNPVNEYAASNAAFALGATGSKDAIPILLQLLRSTDRNTAVMAEVSLRQLTHLQPGDHTLSDPQPTQALWTAWWTRSRDSAHIYKAHECSNLQPLQ